jgi:hypothetical protein
MTPEQFRSAYDAMVAADVLQVQNKLAPVLRAARAAAEAAASEAALRAAAGYTPRGCITYGAMCTCLKVIAAMVSLAGLLAAYNGEPVPPVLGITGLIGLPCAVIVSMMYAGTEF